MDRNILLDYIDQVESQGDQELLDKFTTIVNKLYNDPRITKMPDAAQAELYSKVFNKYHDPSKVQVTPSALEASALRESGGEGGIVSQGEFLGTSGSAERAEGTALESAKEHVGSALAGAGVATAVAGVPIGQALQGTLLNPSTLVTGGIGVVGDMMTQGMGFGIDQGWMSKLGGSGLSMALGMVNPVLGIAANVIGKPLIDLVSDATGMRDLDKMRDSIEDAFGEVGGRQVWADTYNDLQSSFGTDFEGISEDVRGQSIGKTASDMEAKLQMQLDTGLITPTAHAQEMKGIMKLKDLDTRMKDYVGEYGTPYERSVDRAEGRVQALQDRQQAGMLGMTTSELNERKEVAKREGITSITGEEMTRAMMDNRGDSDGSGSLGDSTNSQGGYGASASPGGSNWR